jgi:hypothetical protein
VDTSISPAPTRRRIPLVAVIIVAAFFVGLFGASRLQTVLSTRTIPWEVSAGIGGPPFAATTDSVAYVEVDWPSCVEQRDYSWLTPDVAYLPWSVTITLRTSDTYTAQCGEAGMGGRLPSVGAYLSPLSFPVQLTEPLGGRPLFDGSTFPATERYRP